MNVVNLPFQPPHTETAGYVRPVMIQRAEERAAVSSDPPLRLATEYLQSLRNEVPSEVVEQAIVVLSRLRAQLREIVIPTIAPAPDGLIGMTWEGAHEHVNVQVHPDHRIEYFAENLDTGTIWSDETPWGTASSGLLEHLRQTW